MPDYKRFDPHVRLLQALRSGFGQDADVLVVVNGHPDSRVIALPQGRGTPFHLEWCSSWETPRYTTTTYTPASRGFPRCPLPYFCQPALEHRFSPATQTTL